MDVEFEVFKGRDPEYYSRLEFYPVLMEAAAGVWGEGARKGHLTVELGRADDARPYPGPPEVRNLPGGFGRCTLVLNRDGHVLRRGFQLSELFGPILAARLGRMDQAESHWGFKLRQRRTRLAIIVPRGLLHGIDERPAPEAEGTVEVDLRASPHRPFTLTPIAEPEAAPVEPGQLGIDPSELGKLNVLMPEAIQRKFLSDLPLSERMEEGGFMLGRVSRTGEAHLIEVTHVTPARRSGAGVVHFTFTGESFLEIARLIEERGEGEELVGWYHTHLVGVNIGLSSVDVDLHLATFHKPWQLAALINLTRRGRRLRFYGRGGDGLEEYRQWVSDESGGYRPVGAPLGGD